LLFGEDRAADDCRDARRTRPAVMHHVAMASSAGPASRGHLVGSNDGVGLSALSERDHNGAVAIDREAAACQARRLRGDL
jgi:hypothetical protein